MGSFKAVIEEEIKYENWTEKKQRHWIQIKVSSCEKVFSSFLLKSNSLSCFGFQQNSSSIKIEFNGAFSDLKKKKQRKKSIKTSKFLIEHEHVPYNINWLTHRHQFTFGLFVSIVHIKLLINEITFKWKVGILSVKINKITSAVI